MRTSIRRASWREHLKAIANSDNYLTQLAFTGVWITLLAGFWSVIILIAMNQYQP